MRFLNRLREIIKDAFNSGQASSTNKNDASTDNDGTAPVTSDTASPDWKTQKIRNSKRLHDSDMVWLLTVIIISVAAKVDNGTANTIMWTISAYAMINYNRS